VKDPEALGAAFDALVKATTTIGEMETLVTNLEVAKLPVLLF
jgi:hypothetical protein